MWKSLKKRCHVIPLMFIFKRNFDRKFITNISPTSPRRTESAVPFSLICKKEGELRGSIRDPTKLPFSSQGSDISSLNDTTGVLFSSSLSWCLAQLLSSRPERKQKTWLLQKVLKNREHANQRNGNSYIKNYSDCANKNDGNIYNEDLVYDQENYLPNK